MGWESDYKEEEIVEDHTRVLSKIWDNLIPSTYPYVLEFKTNKAVEVHVTKKMGPYHRSERFIDYDCYVLIDNEPLVKIGWEKGQPISKEMADEAYGENYFHYMRMKMVELSVYSGAKIKSSFDFGGHLDANVKD
jgi:hypothetical protein